MALSRQEQETFDLIKVPSENNPQKPEFPPESPKFPATPTYEIKVPGFSDVWLKDESVNPTGTHKDRMAWEMVVTYRNLLLQKKKDQLHGELPHMSIISSGSAAIAVQTALRKYNLPNLKVLADTHMEARTVAYMKKIDCEVYHVDLSKKAFTWREILALTNNAGGIDITSYPSLGAVTRFYDWMSYEILNSSPDYCFVPFGTGNLYENIFNINKREVSGFFHDPRLKGDVKILQKCNFMGATTNNPKSKADKLYSPHLPFAHFDEQWIQSYRYARYCGPESNVYLIQESALDEAINLAEELEIKCEPSGITGLALMLQMKKRLPKNGKMLVVNTGKTKLEN